MYRLLPGRGDAPTSCRSLSTRFIIHDKLPRKWGDVDNGILQAQLYRDDTVEPGLHLE